MANSARHHWVVRVTHWVNAFALTLMVTDRARASSTRTRRSRRKGGTSAAIRSTASRSPPALTFGGWLGRRPPLALRDDVGAGGERTGLPRLRLSARRVARPRAAPRRHPRHVGDGQVLPRSRARTIRARASTTRCRSGAYFAMPWIRRARRDDRARHLEAGRVRPLTRLMGGYAWARYWHFLAMLALVVLTAGHVFMVFAVDPVFAARDDHRRLRRRECLPKSATRGLPNLLPKRAASQRRPRRRAIQEAP